MPRRILWMDDQTKNKDVSGKVYIVTGANSGVGLETTRHLIRQGGHVVMACRRVDAGEEVAKEFDSLKGSYEVMKLDLSEMASVRAFADAFLAKYERLDGLDCNAGQIIMGNEPTITKDGFELTMSISFIGHFLLTELLLDILKQSAPSRIIMLSSCVHAGNPKNRPAVALDDINYQTRSYNASNAYAEAKVASVLYAMELGKRLEGTGVTVVSVHPGWARSNFGRNNLPLRIMAPFINIILRSATDSNEESAQTSLHCLLSEDVPKHSGAYFSQSSVLYRDPECKDGGWPMTSPNPNAKDMTTARKLVEMTYNMVGLSK